MMQAARQMSTDSYHTDHSVGQDDISVLIVDEAEAVREGLREIIALEPQLRVEVVAETLDAALAMGAAKRIDVVVIGMGAKQYDDLDLFRSVSLVARNAPVIVLTLSDRIPHCLAAFSAGVKGYLLKQDAPALVVFAIHHVLDGNACISKAIRARLRQAGFSDLRCFLGEGTCVVSEPFT